MHTEMIILYCFTLAISIMSFSDDAANFIGKIFFVCSLIMLLEFSIRISKLIAKNLGINVLFIWLIILVIKIYFLFFCKMKKNIILFDKI